MSYKKRLEEHIVTGKRYTTAPKVSDFVLSDDEFWAMWADRASYRSLMQPYWGISGVVLLKYPSARYWPKGWRNKLRRLWTNFIEQFDRKLQRERKNRRQHERFQEMIANFSLEIANNKHLAPRQMALKFQRSYMKDVIR